MTWTDARFFEAFGRHGMLQYTLTAQENNTTSPVSAKVGYFEPDRAYIQRTAQSKDYEVEYQRSDFPWLKAGMSVMLMGPRFPSGAAFTLREPPFVTEFDAQNNNGTYLHALLTKT